MHYKRLMRNGTTDAVLLFTVADRLEKKRKVDALTGCWNWTGAQDGHGYGHLAFHGGTEKAHRASYMEYVGPIEAGMDIDHLCRNRLCVRPDHLQVVPRSTNNIRGLLGFELTKRCRAGVHDVTIEANVIHKSNGERQCRPCFNAAQRARYARNRAARDH